jgi:Icc-related predicted phosphoesterase
MSRKKFLIVYTSDVHGNMAQYTKLFDYAKKHRANAVIIGGDITPKDPVNRTIEKQGEFLKNAFIPLVKKFKKKTDCEIYLILGNDDFKTNEKILKKYTGIIRYSDTILKLNKDFNIIGYPYVPLTPFIYKDWEKLDLMENTKSSSRGIILTEGIYATDTGLMKKKFDLQNRKDTIEHDLNIISKKCDPKKTVFIIHGPPYNTSLDILTNKQHVGSRAIRKFIEKHHPYLTLHGHIHETVDVSGKFMDHIGETICIGSGNHNIGTKIAIITIDLYNPINAARQII